MMDTRPSFGPSFSNTTEWGNLDQILATHEEETSGRGFALPGVDQPRVVLCSIAEVLHTLNVRCALVELLHVLSRKELECLSISTAVWQ